MAQLIPYIVADKEQCIGCKVCEVACHAWHFVKGHTSGNMEGPIFPKLSVGRKTTKNVFRQCHHCENAPCATACPEKAISFSSDAVVVDGNRCRSCNQCVLACPFKVIQLAKQGQVVKYRGDWQFGNKCNMCMGRKQGPVCVEGCPVKALRIFSPQQDKREKNEKTAVELTAIYKKENDLFETDRCRNLSGKKT